MPSYFLHSYKIDLKHAAISASGVYIFGAVGNTLGGLASDYILRRTGDRNKARRNLVVVCFLLSLGFMLPRLKFHELNLVSGCLAPASSFSQFTLRPIWALP